MPQIETKNESVRKLAGLHLYHDPLSSCAMRVRMVLAERNCLGKAMSSTWQRWSTPRQSINQSQRRRPDADP
jgi:hypothetical protein